MKRKTGQGDAENFQWEKDIGLFTVFTVVFQHVGKFIVNCIFIITVLTVLKYKILGFFWEGHQIWLNLSLGFDVWLID